MFSLTTSIATVKRILIACIGNIFLGDDGFGVEVAQHLMNRRSKPYPECVQVVDFGIRDLELVYALLDDYDTLVLVDAMSRGDQPGTLSLIGPIDVDIENDIGISNPRLDTHRMDPMKALTFARTLGARPICTMLLVCEPATACSDEACIEMHMGLSGPVQAAVEEAIKILDVLIGDLLH